MEKLSLILSLLAVVLGSVAYWRAGGKQDVTTAAAALRDELNALKAKQDELVEDLASKVRTAYERAQDGLTHARQRLSELRQESSESLRRQIDRATKQIGDIEGRIADALRTAQQSTIAAARDTQHGLMTRVHRLQARVSILAAQWEAGRALKLADKADFDRAEAHLHDAVARVRDAEATLGDDSAYDSQIEAVNKSLREAIMAAKTKAMEFRSRVEKVVADSDVLISTLENSEEAEEESKATDERARELQTSGS